jgi:hypothetical protein
MDRWLPGQVRQFGRAAIGHDRPNPLLRSDLVMDNAADAKKADKTGVYVVTSPTGIVSHMRFKEGAILPDSAKWRDEGKPQEPSLVERQQAEIEANTEKRALKAAPENRAQ